jgi:predicted CoA-substrate-specific enzyme activase
MVKQNKILGIDIGSTTTKYAVIDDGRNIIAKRYIPTRGRPIEVTQNLLSHLCEEHRNCLDISGMATTGSGRQVVGTFLNADLVIDEITAHARGAIEIDPGIDTILEIGGQDAKYIGIVNSHPLDFDMNKVCAAGTGSFLHELAGKYGINIVGEFQDIAFSSLAPVKLAERCTVFMESDLSSWYQKGVEKKDLVAGLCYAIVHNYLNRVVGNRKIGERIMFLGGPSLNKAVVAAFENVLKTGLIVPAHREVMGAYGAALCVQEKMLRSPKKISRFRGLKSAINDQLTYKEKVCRAKQDCHNQCKLKLYNFGGRKTVWGGECGRFEIHLNKSSNAVNGFKLRRQLWEKHLDGVCNVLQGDPLMEIDGRRTVGMQSAMYGQQTAVLWAHFFDHLGFRLVLSPPTNEKISNAGIAHAEDGVCYPVKVSHGHVSALRGKTRFLFLPTLIDMPGPNASEKGCYCPMVRSNSYYIRGSMKGDWHNTLTPIIHLKKGLSGLTLEISRQIKSRLGVTTRSIKSALSHALEKHNLFMEEAYLYGKRVISEKKPGYPLVVVTGRPYNLYDDRLNLNLGRNLARIGVSSLPMDFIDARKIDLGPFSKIYWGLGAQILRTAKWVSNRTTCFGLHLTNFGCGVDSFIEHFYKYIMEDKPYLILELDEHSAVAGVLTRLEAFKNVIENCMDEIRFSHTSHLKKVAAL